MHGHSSQSGKQKDGRNHLPVPSIRTNKEEAMDHKKLSDSTTQEWQAVNSLKGERLLVVFII